MNKWILRLMSLIVATGLLVGCASDSGNEEGTTNNNQTEQAGDESNSSEQNEEMVDIKISKDKGEETITEKEVAIEEGAILLDIMKENFEVEDEDGFITSIDGVSQDVKEGIGWMYFVNDEMAPVGAGEYELTAGEEVNFDLQAWE